MRVLQIGLSKAKGGVETCISAYASVLLSDGVIFDHADIYGEGLATEEHILENGGRIHSLPSYKKHYFAAQRALRRILETGAYDLVHINMLSAAALMAVKTAVRAGIPTVVHSHNAEAKGLLRKFFHGIKKKALARLPVTRVACSRRAGEFLFGDKDFEVLPNAVFTDTFAFDPAARGEVRRQMDVTDETLVLGYVGRLSEQKNVCYLPRILKAVKEKIPDALLWVVGEGPLREQMMKAAEAGGVSGDILLLNRREQVAPLYAAMDILLLPSLFEGLPMVAVEAQASGLPCIVSDRMTEEVRLTELVSVCSLEENAANWAETVKSVCEAARDRTIDTHMLCHTDYDIHVAAQKLLVVYGRAVAP